MCHPCLGTASEMLRVQSIPVIGDNVEDKSSGHVEATNTSSLDPIRVRLVPNGTNQGLVSTFWLAKKLKFDLISPGWLAEPNILKFDLKKSRICPILDQTRPLWAPI